jgi:hypothetical protein
MTDPVWVLTIEHAHGVDCYVCKTEEVARKKLEAFVRYWWDTEFLETDADYHPAPKVMTDDDMAMYFEKSGEGGEINPAIVIEEA